jgi:reactive intermediate/imine deaminase
MNHKKYIETDNAPKALGTYSQAVMAHDTLYVSGQIAIDPQTNQLITGTFSQRAHCVFQNISAIVRAAGMDLDDVVKLNISLTNLDDFSDLNKVMSDYFHAPYPARACVQVAALPKNTDIEIEAICVRSS